jgi:hypothetical protein
MPQLSDLAEKRIKKKFVKRSYRPWDLSGTHDNIVSDATQAIPVIETPEPVFQDQVTDFDNNYQKINELNNVFHEKISDNDKDNKKITNRQRIDNKQITVREHPDKIKVTIRKQKDNVSDNDISNNLGSDFYIEMIRKLTGIQEKIFHHIVELCSLREELNTGHLLTTDLAIVANCSIGSAKTSLDRLIQKNLVLRNQGKRSRGGHLFLRINKEIQVASAQAKKYIRHIQLGLSGNIIDNNIGNNLPNSSSNNINITTTILLPIDWQEIDYSALTSIGFSMTQLVQLYSKQLNVPSVIQESINHFSYGIEHNPKFKTYHDPLNVFMGVLRKGGAWFEKNYISPKERALEELLKMKKQEVERIDELEKNLLREEYRIWLTNLPNDEKNKIVSAIPGNKFLTKGLVEKATEGHLLQYFKDNIYGKN